MFKKPEDISPLPSGMMNAFNKTIDQQMRNYDSPTQEQVSAPEAEASIPEQDLEEDAKSLTAVRDHGQGKSQYKADNEKSTKERTKEVAALVSEDEDKELDKVDPKAAKKKFKDRKDKDLDNDGDVDDSDEYLHKRRKAISKALESKKAVEESSVDGRTKAFKEKAKALAYAKGSDDLQEKENSYTVVHAKKGKVVVTAPTSYAAAEKAAKQWKLKSTAGVDAYLMEDTDVKKSERENLDEGRMKEFHDYMQKGKSPEFIAKKMGLDLKTVKQLMDHLSESVDVSEAKKWKLTSMSQDEAIKTFGEKNVRLGRKNRLGRSTVEVYTEAVEAKDEKDLDEAYQQFTDKTPNWGEDQALTYGRKKGYKEVAVMGDGKGVHAMVLFALNSEDKKFVKGANVKSGETVFRYATKISIAGDIFPLVKVNIAKGIFYSLTQESSDGSIETAKFENKGVKLKFFRSLEGVKLESMQEAVDSADVDYSGELEEKYRPDEIANSNLFTEVQKLEALEKKVQGLKSKVSDSVLTKAYDDVLKVISRAIASGKKALSSSQKSIDSASKEINKVYDLVSRKKHLFKEDFIEELEEAIDPADMDDMKATKGDKDSAKMNIIVQLRKAADVKGNLDIVFTNGKKQKIPVNIIKIALDKFNSFRKPATKEKLVKAMSKSYKDMLVALKTIKEYSE